MTLVKAHDAAHVLLYIKNNKNNEEKLFTRKKCANVQFFTYSPERSKVMSDCVMTFLTLKVTTFDMIHSYSS